MTLLGTLIVIGAFAGGRAARGAEEVRSSDASSDRAEFQEICRSIRESYDPFYGELRSRELERRLSEPFDTAAQRAAVRATYGRELLKLDRASEAIRELGAAVSEAGTAGLPESVVLDMKVHLGLAYLQAAEDANCVAHHSAQSCILPFGSAAIHRDKEYARRAGDLFAEVVEQFPDAVHSVWLWNLTRMVTNDFPEGVTDRYRIPARRLRSELHFPRWQDRSPELGTDVVDLAGGAVMEDFDLDGYLDLVSSTWDPCGSLKAFRNRGDGGFEDVTEAWGLSDQLGGLNLIHGDLNNDGRADLFVLRGAWMGKLGRIRNSLLENRLSESGPKFVDVTRSAGLAEPAYPTQTAALADYDGDGDLDLYVGNEDPDGGSFPSQLFENRGDGRFSDVSNRAGVENFRFAKAVTWGDYDDDGDPDLYVSNIGSNRLYRNNGDGTFTDVAPALGVTEPEGKSFASWFFDVENDGDLDLLVADYESPVPAVTAFYFGMKLAPNRPRLYRDDGGRFTEVSLEYGLERPMLPMGANFGDLDNDGFLDFYYGTGEPGYETVMPNVMFWNDRGRRFVDVTFAGGFGHLQKGHGVAFGDIDRDGDQDLFHQLGGFFPGDAFANALFENPTTDTSWVTLQLSGVKANRSGVGARIAVKILENGQGRVVHTLVGTGGSFGGSSLEAEIGLGQATAIEEIVVSWPGSGTRQVFRGVAPNRVYRVDEGSDELLPVDVKPFLLHGPAQQAEPDS